VRRGCRLGAVQRRIADGTAYQIVKVPHQSAGLEQQLRELGWDSTVHPAAGPFYWGSGHHNRPF
jgi:hypothetical protein